MTRVRLSREEEDLVARGVFVRVDLGTSAPIGDGLVATSALVGRVGGALRAFANVCRHQAVELDLEDMDPRPPGPGRARLAPLAEDGKSLLCFWHGAIYRPEDGRCIVGPCRGEHLASFTVEVTAEGIAIVLPDC